MLVRVFQIYEWFSLKLYNGSYRGKTLTHDFSHVYLECYDVIFVKKKGLFTEEATVNSTIFLHILLFTKNYLSGNICFYTIR